MFSNNNKYNNNENKLVLLPYSSGANRIRNETITTTAAAIATAATTTITTRVVSNNNNNSSVVLDVPQQFSHVSVLCFGADDNNQFGSNNSNNSSNNHYWNRKKDDRRSENNIGCSNNNNGTTATNLIPDHVDQDTPCFRSRIKKERRSRFSNNNNDRNRIRTSNNAKKLGRRKVEKRIVENKNNYCYNNGAFQGLVAEAVVGTTDANGQVLHLVKWEGREELEFVPAIFTTIKFPHVVLAFYQNRMDLSNNDSISHNDSNNHGVVAFSNNN